LPFLLGSVRADGFGTEVVEHGIEQVVPGGPGPLVGAHPVVDGFERLAVEPVDAVPTLVMASPTNSPTCSSREETVAT